MQGFVVKALFVALVVGAAALPQEIDQDVIELIDDSPEEEVSLGDMDMEMEMSEDDMAMDQRNSFARYTKLHRKKYESKEEYEQRFGIWRDNLDFVRKWNADKSNSFKVGMNVMADLSDAEFAHDFLNPKMHEEFLASETFAAAEEERRKRRKMKALQGERKLGEAEESDEDAELGGTTQGYGYGDGYDIRWHKNTGKQAKDMDWVPKKAITSVDNQGKCFACYAFAACGAIEAAKFINTGQMVKLSAQQILDCSREEFRNHGCTGGTMVKSYKYINTYGLMKNSDYGYNSVLNSKPACKTQHGICKYKKDKVVQSILGYVNVREGDEHDLKNAVAQRPVSVAIDAHHRAFKLYRSGVFSLDSCTTHLTHGVLMVGYGEQDGKEYWKIKNSWGAQWGDGGFGHVVRGKNMCSIADWSNYPIIDDADSKIVSAVKTLKELGDSSSAEEQEEEEEEEYQKLSLRSSADTAPGV